MEAKKKNTDFKNWLRSRFRIVILNDLTFEEKFAYSSTLLRFLTGFLAISFLMIVITITVVAVTPLKEYIPGYGDIYSKRELIKLSLKTDSIENRLNSELWYKNNLAMVLNDKTKAETNSTEKDSTRDYTSLKLEPTLAESQLRAELDSLENVWKNDPERPKELEDLKNLLFVRPVKGIVTKPFNLKENQSGIEIATNKNEVVRATLPGTVVFSGWTKENEFIIQIQHEDNLISCCKNNSKLFKKTGDKVKAGEPIGITGTQMGTNKGINLYFELWFKGESINPQEFVSY